MERKGVAFAGSLLVDNIYEIAAYPSSGELTQIRSIQRATGGMVPNNGIGLKKAAPHLPVFALGKIGEDEGGRYALNELLQNGVDVSGVKVSATEKTSFTDVMSVRGGQRTFFTYSGTSSTFGVEDISWENLSCKMLHLGYFLLLDKVDNGDGLKILREAKERGIKTSIDLVSENSDRYALVLPCLPYVDNLIINETEASRLCKMSPNALFEMAKKLFEYGVKERVIIHTPDVGVCYNGKEFVKLASYSLPDDFIKGTTGAGDAYCTGALLGIYEGKSDEEILRIATDCATCSLRQANATDGLTEYSAMREICKNLKRKEICL